MSISLFERPLPPALKVQLSEASQRRLDAIEDVGYDAMYDLPAVKFRAVEGGRLALHEGGRRTGVTIAVVAYLLDTPRERWLIDCGMPPGTGHDDLHSADDDSPAPGQRYLPELDGPAVAEQIRDLGFQPDRFACTHLHIDHAGGARAVGLTLEARPEELERAERPDADSLGIPVSALAGVPTKAIELDPRRPIGPFAASAQLGDSVIAVDTAGHTPGSVSYLICLGASWGLICGDAVYPRLDEPESPAYLGMLRIRKMLQHWPGMMILAGHDTSILRATRDTWLGGERPT